MTRPPAPLSLAPSEAIAQTGEYSIFGLRRPASGGPARGRRLQFTLILFGSATALAALYALQIYLFRWYVGAPVSLDELFPSELLVTYLWALLAPPVMWVARRFPVRPRGRRPALNWTVQGLALVGFVLAHVTLFTIAQVAFGDIVPATRVAGRFVENLLSWLVADAIVFILLVAVHHAVVFYWASRDRALRASQLEARLAQSQLQVLRGQLHPHFLFNTLNSITALMHKDVKRADSMMTALSDLLRMSFRHVGVQEVPLQIELDFLRRYADIMAIRFGERLRIDVETDPTLHDALVPTFMLQPLVENAIRHGLGDQLANGRITVTVGREQERVRIEVVDNGRGLPAAGIREGVGLSNTQIRLLHLYGDAQSFEITGNPGGGARVTILIPYATAARPAEV